MRYPQGQPVTVSTTITVGGTLTNAGGLTLTVQNPDLTTQTFGSPTNDSTGKYHQDIPASNLTQLGHYLYKWVATGTGAGVSRGDFDVFDPFEPAVLSLQDAKQVVNIPDATTVYDNELQLYVDVATAAIEAMTGGPAYNRSITERTRLMGWNDTTFVLRKRPLVSVTSITNIASGQATDLSDIDLDPNSCIVQRKRELPFWGWAPWYSIVYVAGWGTVVPAAFGLSARIIVQHLWKAQRGPGQASVPSFDGVLIPEVGYAIPPDAFDVLRGTDPNNGLPYLQEFFI